MLYAATAAYVIDAAARDLVVDVRLAMKRADLSLDYVARATGVPHSRLSDQLNGKTPFTAFWRFTAPDIRDSDFWIEFLTLRVERVDRSVVMRDLGRLVGAVEVLIGHKPMQKMALPASSRPSFTRTVSLPLGQKKVQAL